MKAKERPVLFTPNEGHSCSNKKNVLALILIQLYSNCYQLAIVEGKIPVRLTNFLGAALVVALFGYDMIVLKERDTWQTKIRQI